MKRLISISFILFVYLLPVKAQILGNWQAYIPYHKAQYIAYAQNKVFTASRSGIFIFDISTKEITPLSKVQGLSETGITDVFYDDTSGWLFISYENGNIDAYNPDSEDIVNIVAIKNANILSDKKINKIRRWNNRLYFCTGFGIVEMNPISLEISNTFYINEFKNIPVYDIALWNNTFFAATEKGIYYASTTDNLADYTNWKIMSSFPQPDSLVNNIVVYQDRLIANMHTSKYQSDTTYQYDGNTWNVLPQFNSNNHFSFNATNEYLVVCHNYSASVYNTSLQEEKKYYMVENQPIEPKDAYYDKDGNLWLADYKNGLIYGDNTWNTISVYPEGPASEYAYALDFNNGKLAVASGGTTNRLDEKIYLREGFYTYENGEWKNFTSPEYNIDSLSDFLAAAIDPADKNHLFFAANGHGIIELKDNEIINFYNPQNSTLETFSGTQNYYFVGITDIKFDKNGNLWVANSKAQNFLSVRTADGKWYSFDFSALVQFPITGKIHIDYLNQVWLSFPHGEGLLVFNHNNTLDNTSDDQVILLSAEAGKGSLASSSVFAINEDLNGEIWVGTTKGISVISDPSSIFQSSEINAQEIKVDEGGFIQYLLESETVVDIEVDGANRKWIGTNNTGIYLVSETGKEEILHFTKDNSPLFSNEIMDIELNPKTGEVYIATAEGLQSYFSDATEGKPDFSSIYAFPNPVEADYEGTIAITGLTADSYVKITDVAGNLVYSMQANGGLATWNGKNFDGNKVSPGVYLVLCFSRDGEQEGITKILVK